MNSASEPTSTAPLAPLLRIVILNYRTADLTIDCLSSLANQVPELPGASVVVVDNASGNGSAEQIAEAIDHQGWSGWVELLALDTNGGFSAGNNTGMTRGTASSGAPAPEFLLLLNSDTIVRPGALESLLSAARERADAGLIGPRLEWPNGQPQISRFRFPSPASELIDAAATGPVTRILKRFDVPLPVTDQPAEADWISFACVLIRQSVIDQVGLMDDGYFMYFDDVDYCWRVRRAGWSVLHWPGARVVHLRGGSAPVKTQLAHRKRVSRYYYASRARYFAKAWGPAGPLLANLGWMAGRSLSLTRELIGHKAPHTAELQYRDIWVNWWSAFHQQPPVGDSPP